MNDTAAQISTLSAEKRALLAGLLKNGTKAGKKAVPKRPRENARPLSFAQERMWFLAQLDPDNPNYNVAGAVRISGCLNIPLLERCVDEVVRRHEVLRTAFRTVNGRAEQYLLDDMKVPLSFRDLSRFSSPGGEAELRRLISRELQTPFALSDGRPLLRMTLLQIKPQEFVLLLSMHHIVSDEGSLRLLIGEIGQLYQAFIQGKPSPLAELAIQYADYADWQRSTLDRETRNKQLAYWLRLLSGAPQVLALPSDRSRPAVRSNRGAVYPIVLPKALSERIMQLSRALEMTLFMTLMGAFSLLLHRSTSQADLCIGYPASNRNKPEFERLIGLFVNTLAMRSQLTGNPRAADFLTQIRRSLLDAQKHQDLPFEQLVEELNPERTLSYHPVFQAMFVFQNASMGLPEIPGLRFELIDGEHTASKFDLTLSAIKTQDGIACRFGYNTDIFETNTVARMAGHFETLLEGIAGQPEARISELPWLTAAERRQVVFGWNMTEADYPKGRCIPALFEAQAKKTPDAVALVFEEQALTYAELNARANRLARYLRAKGVGPEMLVALCVKRSLAMVIGLLGIWKAGGAYVPIDPGYPQERIMRLVEDSGAPVILTQTAPLDYLQSSGIIPICMDKEWPDISKQSAMNLAVALEGRNLAYVIYTSGSTGKPKGVMIRHDSVTNLNEGLRRAIYGDEPAPPLRFALNAPIVFDSSVKQLLALLNGHALCLIPEEVRLDSLAFINYLKSKQIDVLDCTPTQLKNLISASRLTHSKLYPKIVLVGGESIDPSLWRDLAGITDTRFLNVYGPTECTVDSTLCEIRDIHPQPLIGKPLMNTGILLLARDNSLVPVGVPGEIHIKGEGLARGYLNRPDLTAEKFVPDPFGEAGGRLYKTGDLARYREDGNLEYLGRLDNQVKIRGFRIEPGEIEAWLLRHPAVKASVVLARDDSAVGKILVAYVVKSNPALTTEELLVYLKKNLPAYMVPADFVYLEALPLNFNGKIDLKALPMPCTRAGGKDRYSAPQTSTEAMIAERWCELLGIESAGIHDDFFYLGGHSLLVTQFLFWVRQRFNVNLTVKSFFEAPTISAQARIIDAGGVIPVFDRVSVDLEAEASLDPAIVPLKPYEKKAAEARRVLLTGATGFLGVFLLGELLRQSRAKIYCLIRAENEGAAKRKLRKQLSLYELAGQIDDKRIVPVCGDLTKPRLGLSDRQYGRLAREIDAIYHNGAQVNFVQSYPSLKPANVLGTQEVLRLACAGQTKPVHYVSTVSVFGDRHSPDPDGFKENDLPDAKANFNGGYAQSKWVAERLVKIAGERGLPVCIYRPGRIAGDSRSGVWNHDDFVCRVIKGCIQMAMAPEETIRMDMASVDYVSRAIVSLSFLPESHGRVFHINAPQPLYSKDLLDWLSSSGFVMDRVPYDVWRIRLAETAEKMADFALSSLIPVLPHHAPSEKPENIGNTMRYDCRETLRKLAESGIEYRPVDQAMVNGYLAYFDRSRFLELPENNAAGTN
jgi:myxalamid-type nonribosomal peptide synthetase MxaA